MGEIWKITSVALAFIVVSLLAYAMWLKGNNTQLQSEIDGLHPVNAFYRFHTGKH